MYINYDKCSNRISKEVQNSIFLRYDLRKSMKNEFQPNQEDVASPSFILGNSFFFFGNLKVKDTDN